MSDYDKQYRAMHPSQAQQFHADDTQTPESRENLRDEIAMITVYTDSTPISNEPTELETLLKQYGAEHVLDEIVQLITAVVQQSNRELLLNLKRQIPAGQKHSGDSWYRGYTSAQIKTRKIINDELAALERQQAREEQAQ